MEQDSLRNQLLNVTALSAKYCATLEHSREMERDEFVNVILGLLPRLYYEFSELKADDIDAGLEYGYFLSYVDEDFYESIRRNVESLLGPDDIFLETFEEDMKYSDTPIAASISECLADIFQPLYNFIAVVKESDGSQQAEAYRECKENFDSYWSQTLCNVMRALNYLRYNSDN